MHPEKTAQAMAARPFNQKIRIAALRLVFALLVPLVVFTRSRWIGMPVMPGLLETAGILAIIGAVLGRFWSILYIGGRKNALVMRDGPYSICRHPLYLFSTIGVIGFGLMLDSLTLAAVFGAAAYAILSATAAREERFLRQTFGTDYDSYMRDVPRMVPNLRAFSTPGRISLETATLGRNAADALVFIALIPLAEILKWAQSLDMVRPVLLF